MSNLDPEKFYDNLPDLLEFVFRQMLSGIYTAMPGTIVSYDPNTKRAKVQPSLDMLGTDGTTTQRPTVVNVPVIFPSGGGFTFLTPVTAGDQVLMLFSQRGLTRYKAVFARTTPDETGFFSIKDAMALPGFGALQVTPFSTTGLSMQTEDGTNAIAVENGTIRVLTPGDVNIQAGSITATVTGNADVTAGNVNVTATTATSVTAPANTVNGPLTVTGPISAPTVAAATGMTIAGVAVPDTNHTHGAGTYTNASGQVTGVSGSVS